MKRFDAAIVGAGPAGSSAAVFLARKGYSVALVEKQRFPREKLCGDFLNPANWEIFEKLGIEDALLSLPHGKVGSFRMSTPSAAAKIPFPSQNGRRDFGIGLRRSLFDDLLLRLAEKEGVAVRQGCKLGHFSRENDQWIMTSDDSSVEDKFHSRLLIGADGRNSWVAHRMGAALPGEAAGRFVGFQLHLRNCRNIDGEVQIHLFPGGYGGLVGLGEGMANLCFIVEKNIAGENPSVEHLLRKHLYRNSRFEEALGVSEIVGEARSVYPVYFSPRRSFGDGFLLAGDAARVTEPITGEGVYFALKSGELAADAADLAFKRGDFSARQLSSYDSACRSALGRRQIVNRIIRAVIHRPNWVRLLLGLSRKNHFPVSALVNLVCRPSSI
jgi:menaquinone-9 beta-reductase